MDIELLLETAEKIENKGEDPLLEFYENKMLKLERNSSYNSILKKKDLSNEIIRFIKVYFSQTNIQTDYRQCINDFVRKYSKPLHIFSTNYDICIEQFCKKSNHWLLPVCKVFLELI